MAVQLSLGVSLRDDATFHNFYIGKGNDLVVHALQQFSRAEGEQNIMLWGRAGAGLTHLLQASCHAAHQQKLDIQYLPMGEMASFAPKPVCEGLDQFPLVCIDDIEQICGNGQWEQTVFHLFNRLRDAGHRLLIASHSSPAALPMLLPDLKSRLLGSVIYQLHALDDSEKACALQMRAKARGMDMPEEVSRFILSRAVRDSGQIFALLDLLDRASLQHQRKLTIPFVKEVLGF